MSRIKSDKISIADSIVVDFFSSQNEESQSLDSDGNNPVNDDTRLNLIQIEAQDKAQKLLDEANLKAQEILNAAKLEADEIKEKARLEALNINDEAAELSEKTKNDAQTLIETAQADALQIKENARQEGAQEGYQLGYDDGLKKIQEELLQKVNYMDEFVKSTFDMKNKILAQSKKEIVNLVLMIARKISINSVNAQCVASVLDKSISLLNDKENIEVILSERYAQLLNQILNGDLIEQNGDLEIDIDKLKNIKLIYNAKMPDDTLIVQTPKERLDLSFNSQLNQISKEFLKELNSSFDKKDEGEIGGV